MQQKPSPLTFNTLVSSRNTCTPLSMLGVFLLTLAVMAQALSLPPQLDLVSPLSDTNVFPNGSFSIPASQNLTAGPTFFCDKRYGILTDPEPCHDAFLKIPIYANDQRFIYRRYGHNSGYMFVQYLSLTTLNFAYLFILD